jgi:DNA-binding NarL/FixJ family response regulator
VWNNPGVSAEIPPEIRSALGAIDPDIAQGLIDALEPVAAELGPRECAVLERLITGIATKASAAELNAFVRLLPVTVSRVVSPAIEPVTAAP